MSGVQMLRWLRSPAVTAALCIVAGYRLYQAATVYVSWLPELTVAYGLAYINGLGPGAFVLIPAFAALLLYPARLWANSAAAVACRSRGRLLGRYLASAVQVAAVYAALLAVVPVPVLALRLDTAPTTVAYLLLTWGVQAVFFAALAMLCFAVAFVARTVAAAVPVLLVCGVWDYAMASIPGVGVPALAWGRAYIRQPLAAEGTIAAFAYLGAVLAVLVALFGLAVMRRDMLANQEV